jgi:folate-dependent phosphoribosylglycinamide formyltransferase PurN
MFSPFFSGNLPMRVVILMSGSGSNAENLIKNPENGKSYQIVGILTNNKNCNAKKIAKNNHLEYLENDLDDFYKKHHEPKNNLSLRAQFDQKSVELLLPLKPDVLAYCGYMAIASSVLVSAVLGVNVHPADLRILNKKGKRRFVGAHAVRDAILAGQTQLRSTTHIVSNEVDGGPILMVSNPVSVLLPKGFNPENEEQLNTLAKKLQEKLKKEGDFIIYPKTLKNIAINNKKRENHE